MARICNILESSGEYFTARIEIFLNDSLLLGLVLHSIEGYLMQTLVYDFYDIKVIGVHVAFFIHLCCG